MKNKLNNRPFTGRKFAPVLERRSIIKSIKFSCNDLDVAFKRQRESGYTSFSTFGRDCILNTRIVARMTPDQQKLLRNIEREGDNLNQIAKACNARNCWGVAKAALNLMKRLDAICDRFDELPQNSV